ncbi:MAG: aspartate carbamoyltransferase [SAR86 cluster bacterium BACL1 MAG-121105-bin34]|jgi:aspartate carbamoyltransferase catalytic subunit|uniref:Aspartate carbamoyltransferase n=1 Tax=SAR86 cluster bacterium BACL1 MAG-120820-bin45 TaxID=1655612 RepID=A0A0R2UAW5_9GAMM|nr:MAG: aspartate carbamoyltransferase [SAR86 cluster bacterium BACL1 MAG-120507-bin14]KRO96372.1 MAG: aspartate carbamoyltransferase [SAR86 cluster bacterium BACL1 MAG-120820-bin45]KRO97663.1 MAG: aspartate carbamoyltransferase [SAR86 cluster bacterium BACL1 MAG-120828-bin5]KRO99544.1 MAG: aspartate carbamoyltransferase [SAR86 cluster bacterium BACL1 MAG-120823-bin87]KRP00533.1 MAG: aspartate carbamoyltransferase [SAR86 cluster bacterium BACL1 MAG-120813-bin36]KRP02463.1 MAG: aspartate carbam
MSQNLLNLADFTEKDILELIDLANNFQTNDPVGYRHENIFPDKKVASIFCEPSTRTKLSFEIATHNLGAKYLDFNLANSSMQKGETLEDTLEAMMLMGIDLCILRHSDSSIHALAKKFPSLQFVNAGEGSVGHPSQALLDLMTIREFKKSFVDLKITIVGDLDHSRVVSSFLEAIQIVGFKTITFCGHPDLCKNYLENSLGNFEPDLETAMEDADVVMALRIQNERLTEKLTISASDYVERYQINVDSLQVASPETILLHPGPVNFGIELDQEAAKLDNCKIKNQIFNGVGMRMAVLTKLFSQA